MVIIFAVLGCCFASSPLDMNHDGRIDVKDIALVASALGSVPGHPRWNNYYDINQDGVVNIKDVVTVADSFGF